MSSIGEKSNFFDGSKNCANTKAKTTLIYVKQSPRPPRSTHVIKSLILSGFYLHTNDTSQFLPQMQDLQNLLIHANK